MARYFFDSSAAVKRYALETGSTWITSLTDPSAGNVCFLAAITRVEIVSAIHQKVRAAQLSLTDAQQAEQSFRSELGTHFHVVAITSAILDRAMDLVSVHPLRAYDTVQLSTALFLQTQSTPLGLPSLTFISADQALNQAAAAEGLLVDDPNHHP